MQPRMNARRSIPDFLCPSILKDYRELSAAYWWLAHCSSPARRAVFRDAPEVPTSVVFDTDGANTAQVDQVMQHGLWTFRQGAD